MSNAIEKSSASMPSVLAANDAARAAPVTSATAAAKPVESAASNPMAMVETKAKVGTELESNYKKLEAAVDEIRQMADDNLLNLGFAIDKKINTQVVVVSDKTTGEVIRQIPNEVVIRVAHNIADLKGVLFDGKY